MYVSPQIDFDEFVYPAKHETIPELLTRHDPVSRGQSLLGVQLQCWFFGSDIVNGTDQTKTMMETYIKRAKTFYTGGRHKLIVYLANVSGMEVHSVLGSGQVENLKPSEVFFAHYWKNRGGKMNEEVFDGLAQRYGRTVWARVSEVARQQNLTAWGGPWPTDVYM